MPTSGPKKPDGREDYGPGVTGGYARALGRGAELLSPLWELVDGTWMLRIATVFAALFLVGLIGWPALVIFGWRFLGWFR